MPREVSFERGYILDPADVKGPDYPSARRVLRNNEIARFGEYRTALLILQAWDALEPKELLWWSRPALTQLRPSEGLVEQCGIPADHEFLAFFQSCEPPTQFYDILTHRTFHYSLFFDPKPEGLGR